MSLSMAQFAYSDAILPSVQPGFPTDYYCEPGQLLAREVGLGRIGNIAYHNGVVYSNNVGGGARREIRFLNPIDPGSLAIVSENNLPVFHTQGTHSHLKVGEWLFSDWGGRIRAQTPGININEVHAEANIWQQQKAPEGGGLHRMYWPWAVPFNWVQYGASPGRGRLWRYDKLLAEWEPLAADGVSGTGILIGNVLLIVSDASNLGVVAYDIGPTFNDPPEPLQVLDKLSGSFGGYIGAVWENYLVLAGGNPRHLLHVIDYSDPTDLKLVTTLDLTGTPELNAGTSVPYVQTQDEYVFTRRHKINMQTLTPVLELDEVGDHRPLGSEGGPLDVSQYTLPLGNLLISGSYSAQGRDGFGVWCHQKQPDRRGPYVGYHIPRPDQTQYPLGAPITLVIAEELESFTIINGETIIVRPIGGEPIDAWISFAHDGVLTITPKEYLMPNTTYQVIVVGGGIKDVSGNAIEGLSFSFSTGGDLSGGNRSPDIHSIDREPIISSPGERVTIQVNASDPEGDPLLYRFSMGDGSPPTDWVEGNQMTHVFEDSGHFEIKVQVRDQKSDGMVSVQTSSIMQTVAMTIVSPMPTHSSSIAIDDVRRTVWVAHPDQGTVGRIDADTGQFLSEIDLDAALSVSSSKPLSIALAHSGRVWVTASGADAVVVLEPNGSLVDVIRLNYGTAPQGVVASSDGSTVYVSTKAGAEQNRAHGQLIKIDARTLSLQSTMTLGPWPSAMALSSDGSTIYVGRFLSDKDFGEIWQVDAVSMRINHTLELWRDRGDLGLDSGGSDGPGVPNYISSVVLSPQEDWLWYAGIKMATNRGEFFDQGLGVNLPLSHDSTVRSVLGRFDLSDPSKKPIEPGYAATGADRGRVDIDNSIQPSSLLFSPMGNYVFLTLQGNDALAVLDDFQVRRGGAKPTLWRAATGHAPKGSAWDRNTNSIWVHNFLSRDVTKFPMQGFLNTGRLSVQGQTFKSTYREVLTPDELAGKRLFYFAGNDPFGVNKMSFEGYIACASCHIDGGHDGRIWDFTQRGEGLRNTADLRGRGGQEDDRLHWSGNFDELQDFEIEIVRDFQGIGFLLNEETAHDPLGAPNAGRSEELDQLAAYVDSLRADSTSKSPHRKADGFLTASALRGRDLFDELACHSCHQSGSGQASEPELYNVGTLRDSSGQRLGGPLVGIDAPSLVGLWETSPYFHDGSAVKLSDVFKAAGGSIYQAEEAELSGQASVEGVSSVQINHDSASHGQAVDLRVDGDSITWHHVDGGTGGLGALEFRYTAGRTSPIEVWVNGFLAWQGELMPGRVTREYKRLRLTDIPLTTGQSNIVTLTLTENRWPRPKIDHMTVSTADDIGQTEPHRKASRLSQAEFDDLLDYLLQIDGRTEEVSPVEPGYIFRDSMEAKAL